MGPNAVTTGTKTDDTAAVAQRAFRQNHSPETFAAWASASPRDAAKWLAAEGERTGTAVDLAALKSIVSPPKGDKTPLPTKVSVLDELYRKVYGGPIGGPVGGATNDQTWQQRGPGERTVSPQTVAATNAADRADATRDAFSASRTRENFKAWADASPAGAGLWLKKVATAVDDGDTNKSIDTILQSPKGKGAELDALYGKLEKVKLDAIPANNGYGYGAQPDANATTKTKRLDPPALTGRLSREGDPTNGKVFIDTPAGKFEIASPPGYNSSTELSGSDARTFNGQMVTVKGWPGKADPNAYGATPADPNAKAAPLLAVEQFAPGASPDFVSGRISAHGTNTGYGQPQPAAATEDVYVQTRSSQRAKIADPNLANAMRKYDQLGVILPGAAEKKGNELVYGAKPADYYVLGGWSNAYGVKPPDDPKKPVEFTLQLGHGKSAKCIMPRAVWDDGERGQRHYLLGHFDKEGTFVVKGRGGNAGMFPQGIGAEPSVDFVMKAINVKDPVISANDRSFEKGVPQD